MREPMKPAPPVRLGGQQVVTMKEANRQAAAAATAAGGGEPNPRRSDPATPLHPH